MKGLSKTSKYCTICRTWIADNKAQRAQHENGQKHKGNLSKLLKEIARKNDRRRSEARLAGDDVVGGGGVEASRAKRNLMECVQKAIGGVDNVTQEKAGNDGEDGGAFPLPAHCMYGEWVTVTDDDDVEEVDKQVDGGEDRVGQEKKIIEENEVQETTRQENEVQGTTIQESEEARDEVVGVFKRRRAPLKRRVRKK